MKLLLSLVHPSTQEMAHLLEQSPETNTLNTPDLEEFHDQLLCYDYDVVLLDHVTNLKATEILINDIKRTHPDSLIVFITGTQNLEESEIINLLDIGVDKLIDYQISLAVLIAKIRAYLRRIRGLESSIIQVGNIYINISQHQVIVGKKRVDLTKKEQDILECLALNKGKVLSKEFLLEYLYGGMDEPEIRIIDAFIWRIRKKLVDAGQKKDYMQTVWGRGYCLSEV